MKAIVVMFDSLNRHLLNTYGCDWTVTPNFQRLSQKALTFDTSYVGSMPCMPARRDLHTGRLNFLHRSWGPLEPWDDSCFAHLKASGVYTHIVTDHQHYWEEGAGGNYLSKYNTHQIVRGQEGDPCYGMVKPPPFADNAIGRNAADGLMFTQDRVNRTQVHSAEDMPMIKTFNEGIDFINRHASLDNWLLQVETFDPHEPFFVLDEHKQAYADFYEKSRKLLWDWPAYTHTTESPEEIELMRHNYAALLTLCDAQLGRVLDVMDAHDMWDDTMLVVWTDHGFSLGEHDCWAKCWLPFYEEIAHTPFFVWDPRYKTIAGQRRKALVQPSVDLAPTLLEFFGLKATPDMTGKSLTPVIAEDSAIHETVIFGQHGYQVNITDGRYVYMRGPATEENTPLYEYTLMPSHMRHAFTPDEFENATLALPFKFTKGISALRLPAIPWAMNNHPDRMATRLYDLEQDPMQVYPIEDSAVEADMCAALIQHFKDLDAPAEQMVRLGL